MATQETIKQLFSGGVLRDIEDVYARQTITALQNALNALTSGDTTTAIENFQEVIDFLAGVTDDATLIGKLNELRTLINEKYTKPSTGIPASDLANGVIPDVSGLATKTEVNTGLAGKVDKVTGKGLSKNDYTDADKTAVGTIGSKANDNVVVKSISVNGQTPQTPTEGNVNIEVTGVKGDDGITPHIGQNGHWWLGTTDTGVNATGNDGQSITDADLVIGNALNGQGDVLGMSGAMKMKSNIDAVQANLVKLYNKLANMAFWDATDQADAEPIPNLLDWSVPKVTVAITNSIGSGAVIKRGGTVVSGSLQVDQGDSLTLTIEAAPNNVLSNDIAATVDGVSASLTESDGVYTLAIAHVNAAMAIAISGTATPAYGITLNLTGCHRTSGPSSIQEGGTATIQLQADAMFSMPATLPSGAVTGASVTSYTVDANDNTKATLVIGNVSGNVSIVVEATSMVMMTKDMFYIIQRANGSNPNLFGLTTLAVNSSCDKRACLYMNRADVDNPCTFNTTGTPYPDAIDHDAEATYTAIPIPSGATKISIKCNAGYYYFPGLVDANATVLNTNTQWFVGSTKTEFNLSDYPTATHFAVSFKIGSAGTAAFSNETYESMEIEFNIE